ncbi:hypothetical protein LEP1GSC047_3612 [Leptospira inadai serovar Lyme str. 10]|uniref:DUF6946 domain-containing protein n=2 Tax=Leptospira inadai serovar Lyme TaxID=293084 RepID=V6HWJ2_9LEPT|nr:hypothetical protein [Leptospira inadai]EQA37329.1 hypothetical protein LEP1GSC047_3612 [Leptospira inadai serovar Lyme str. 10]PNV74968.1 hypothetical protein BES34_010360 [Leptospira inadai serovar Lyme]
MFLKEIRHFYEWKDLLYSPEHFVQGFPAFELAREWQEAEGIPEGVSNRFSRLKELSDLKFMFGIPQYKISMPPLSQQSQADLLAFCKNRAGLWILAVDGKESLGPIISDWLEESPARLQKLSSLLSTLGIRLERTLSLRYQLLRRLYSLVSVMDDFSTPRGIFLVQSFGKNPGIQTDFNQLLEAFEIVPNHDFLPEPSIIGGRSIYFALHRSLEI